MIIGKESTLSFAIKAGAISLTKTLAIELASFNINANAVCPAMVYTDMYSNCLKALHPNADPWETYEKLFKENLYFHREITCEDVTNAAVWLSTEETRNMTGQVLFVTAGGENSIGRASSLPTDFV